MTLGHLNEQQLTWQTVKKGRIYQIPQVGIALRELLCISCGYVALYSISLPLLESGQSPPQCVFTGYRNVHYLVLSKAGSVVRMCTNTAHNGSACRFQTGSEHWEENDSMLITACRRFRFGLINICTLYMFGWLMAEVGTDLLNCRIILF